MFSKVDIKIEGVDPINIAVHKTIKHNTCDEILDSISALCQAKLHNTKHVSQTRHFVRACLAKNTLLSYQVAIYT